MSKIDCTCLLDSHHLPPKPKFVLVLPLLPFHKISVNMFVWLECVGGSWSKRVRKIVWLKACIDRFESTGTNLFCLAQYNGHQTQGRGQACDCGNMSTSWMFSWVCGLIYVGKWWSISVILCLCLQRKPIKSFYSVEGIGRNTKATVKTLTHWQDLTCDLRFVKSS